MFVSFDSQFSDFDMFNSQNKYSTYIPGISTYFYLNQKPQVNQTPLFFKGTMSKNKSNQCNLLVSWNKQSEYCKNNKLEFPHKQALHLLRKKIQLPLKQPKFKKFIVKLVNLNSNKEKDKSLKKTVPFGDQLNLLRN